MFFIKHPKYYLAVLITISAYNFHQGFAQPTGVLRTKPSTQLSNFHSIKLNTKLFSRTLLFLQINQNGEVSGTTSCSSQFGNRHAQQRHATYLATVFGVVASFASILPTSVNVWDRLRKRKRLLHMRTF
ncbi:uncharacterized protein LOC116289053 [Actinia tenebrosa]|uniref:Uncharacterized protein LOC116289053 n=1 Tax=Actinia tenebrosa TaxID=6105 RepID=A0A6P8H8H5_ACTTE|nr:uncharacterized protein LOC116289053 [Actinia tenebrosa]